MIIFECFELFDLVSHILYKCFLDVYLFDREVLSCLVVNGLDYWSETALSEFAEDGVALLE